MKRLAAGLAVALAAGAAMGQDVVVASLPFLGGQTSGPNGTDYPPPNDAKDLWIIEDFGGQYLAAGSYYVVWDASTVGTQIVVIWAQGGAHAVGGGLPENAWLWNPNGGWGFTNNIKKVPADLNGNGQTGVNFALYGSPVGCYANCDDSMSAPRLNANDFQCFINRFAAGAAYANCDGSSLAPILNVNDFQCFLNAFAAGCS